MNTQLSNAKQITIPGPDHPITISPAAHSAYCPYKDDWRTTTLRSTE